MLIEDLLTGDELVVCFDGKCIIPMFESSTKDGYKSCVYDIAFPIPISLLLKYNKLTKFILNLRRFLPNKIISYFNTHTELLGLYEVKKDIYDIKLIELEDLDYSLDIGCYAISM